MKQTLFVFAAISVLVAFSCKAVKKAEKVQKQIEKKDTSKIVIVTPNTQTAELDSLRLTLAQLDSEKISSFHTFSAKAKVDYNSGDNSQSANANIRIQEDSIIWVSLTGPLGIEGFRAKITQDSLILMDKLHHTILRRNISYLQEILKVPLAFNDIQNIILGNPVFTKGDITSYKHPHNRWFISIRENNLNNLITLIDKNKKLILKHSRLQDSTETYNRICDITYSNHQAIDSSKGKWFSQTRDMILSNKTSVNVKLQFKQFKLGTDIDFPFSIPSSYTEK
ncbi:hypothetical protein A9P82_04005 [Arachidicoccus ginsenosidimutans]|uniref:DUF4292 domain-containing protein n=1 Tax=Arachidicoccus sp. BS20 TaxID=1850526 RepID=UPI0007F133C1|nr:DUF4292 domain-containing protein [Arachidicoccus sp. BS20]ANI88534.1 hypothetical protein A9P82_04005 [Arachidicoccus sp. BS20]